jgi:DNA-directed RNA polymerase subunit RPC12/RpoP
MTYEDKTLICKDCGKDFVFGANDQEFFASKQFSDPVRCRDCRAKKKAAQPRNNY